MAEKTPEEIALERIEKTDPSTTIEWEWLKWWANEVHHISGIVWIALFVKLPAIEAIDEQAQGTFQCIRATRETT